MGLNKKPWYFSMIFNVDNVQACLIVITMKWASLTSQMKLITRHDSPVKSPIARNTYCALGTYLIDNKMIRAVLNKCCSMKYSILWLRRHILHLKYLVFATVWLTCVTLLVLTKIREAQSNSRKIQVTFNFFNYFLHKLNNFILCACLT